MGGKVSRGVTSIAYACFCVREGGLRGLEGRVVDSLSAMGPEGRCDFPTSVFSKMDRSLLRRGVKSLLPARFSVFGEKWGAAFARYFYLIGQDNVLEWALPLLRKCCASDEESFIGRLKEVSRLCTEYTVHAGFTAAAYLMDIHVLGGYDTELNRVDVLLNVRSEIGVAPKPIDEKLQERMLRRIRSIVSSELKFKLVEAGFKKFIRFRDAWSTSGATTLEGKVKLETADGEVLKVKGKLASSLKFDDNELYELAMAPTAAVVKPFRKLDEKVKTRVVYGYDFFSYLRCSYVDSLMSSICASSEWCPIGCGPREKHEMRTRLWSALADPSCVAVSLDQSAFDTRQRKEWIRECLVGIFDVVQTTYDGAGMGEVADELRRLCEVELYSFDNAHAGDVKHEVGVLSGMKWTALIDSILNRAAAEIAAEDLNFKVVEQRFQGDDAVLIGKPGVGGDWAGAYRGLGLEVNALKTWVSDRSFDFLHEIYVGGEVLAFPARVGSSIVWKKPAMGGTIDSKVARFWARSADLLKGVRRGLLRCSVVMSGMLRRFVSEAGGHATGAVLSEVMDTPRYLGGLGFGQSGRRAMVIGGGRVMWRRYHLEGGLVRRFGGTSCAPALLDRLSRGVFLRTTPVTVSFGKLKGAGEADSYGGFGDGKPLIRSFRWTDGVAWTRQLRFESAVRGYDVERCDAPDQRLAGASVRRIRDVYSTFERWSGGLSTSVESAEDTGERFAHIADKVNRLWVYSLSILCLHSRSEASKFEGMRRSLQRMLLGAVSRYGLGMRIRV